MARLERAFGWRLGVEALAEVIPTPAPLPERLERELPRQGEFPLGPQQLDDLGSSSRVSLAGSEAAATPRDPSWLIRLMPAPVAGSVRVATMHSRRSQPTTPGGPPGRSS